MTRAELLEVVYRFYPRGVLSHERRHVPPGEPVYDDTEEQLRLVDSAQRGRDEYATWKAMIRRLGDQHRLQNESLHLLAGGVDPAYSARIWLTDERALSFHVSLLGPYYGIHGTGEPAEAPVASEVAREIEATYPGYQPIPPELGNEVVPDVHGSQALGKATIYVCLFSEVWEWVDLRSPSPAEVAVEHASNALRAARLERVATVLAAAQPEPMERAHLDAMAHLVADIAAELASVDDSPAEPTTLRSMIAAVLARSDLPLTQAAWQWVLGEEDREVLRFLVALVTLEGPGLGADALAVLLAAWRALIESRALCGAAVAAIRAELLLDAQEGLL